jgi:prepilin-type processing-associated H-X9-DG protein
VVSDANVVSPATLVCMVDCVGGSNGQSWAGVKEANYANCYYWGSNEIGAHNGGENYAFADGHAKWYTDQFHNLDGVGQAHYLGISWQPSVP